MGKSSNSFNPGRHLRRYLVLRGLKEDSAQVAKEIRPRKAKLVLRHVPGKLRERPRQRERLESRPPLLLHSPEL